MLSSNQSQHYDAIVLGAGGVGSAAAFHLARRGAKVMAIEQFTGGHALGSSHGETRVIRQAYFEHADYVPLLLRAYEHWRELEELTGLKLLEQVGLLEVGPASGCVVPGVLRAAAVHGLAVDELSATDVAERFPGFQIPEGMSAVFERAAGYLRVERCVLAHLAAAKAAGADFAFHTRVVDWRADEKRVTVSTDRGQFQADRLVIAAGAWAPRLLADLGIGLRVLRKHLYWFASSNPAFRQDVACPTYLFEMPQGVFYGFPQIDALGVKVAEHSGGQEVADPLHDPRAFDELDAARVEQFLATCMPGVGHPVACHTVCFYTMSPDENFIVDRHPRWPHVAFAAGLSGHGFKFTSVLGEVLAELTLDGRSSLPISFLGLPRFSGERLVR